MCTLNRIGPPRHRTPTSGTVYLQEKRAWESGRVSVFLPHYMMCLKRAIAASLTRHKPLVQELADGQSAFILHLYIISHPLCLRYPHGSREFPLLFHFLLHHLTGKLLYGCLTPTVLQHKCGQILLADLPGFCDSFSQYSYHCLPMLLPSTHSNNVCLASSTTPLSQ